jgi:hypothetical protein
MKYIIVIGLLAILYASNPSLEDHQNAVKEKISKIFKSQISTDEKTTSTVGEIGTAIGTLFGNSLLEGIVKEIVKRKDYFFFSLTSVEYNGYNKVIGIGIIGNVYISEEVEKEFNKEKYVQKLKQ